MAISRIREYSYPNVEDLDGLIQWARDHHREHMEEGASRIVELNEFDHARYMADVYLGTTQTNLVDSTWTTVELDSVFTNSGSRFDTTTFTYTAPMTRKYQMSGSVAFTNCVADKWYAGRIFLNGDTTLAYSMQNSVDDVDVVVNMSRLATLDEGDTLVLQAISYSGDDTVDVYGSAAVITTYLTVHIVG